VPDTRNAAFLVKTGAAKFGLMYATDVAANPELAVAAVLDPAIAKPVMFAAALNVKPRSPKARACIDFLRSADTSQLLTQHGLELV
jgi:molybdate transport system substrate-binding protein